MRIVNKQWLVFDIGKYHAFWSHVHKIYYYVLLLPLFPCVPAVFQKCIQRPKITLNFMLISWFCNVFSFNPREIDLRRPKWTLGAQICVTWRWPLDGRLVGRVGMYYIHENHLTCAHNNIKKENDHHLNIKRLSLFRNKGFMLKEMSW